MKLQDLVLAFDHFWAGKGAMIQQPYVVEVGAGTMSPHTFLRVLGPEPWNVSFVQPSRRPADGRYGDNPNRVFQHHQYQVVVKPSPDDIQEIYLQSLAHVGIDPVEHDIRFVEDNWESPTLGAWGTGWEVWVDGMEITQFTYFQQVGGIDLKPVSVEITYGLERLATYLQGVDSLFDLKWSEDVTYGEMYREAEREYSVHAFEFSDPEFLKASFEAHEREAQRHLEAGLIHPGYDHVLKCSHTFNLLDARGAFGVAQRAAYMGRVRALARSVAMAWVARREALGYPLLNKEGCSNG